MKRRIFAVLFAATIFCSTSVANAENADGVIFDEYSESEVTPRADVIVKKYRVHNGVIQYRRWNETKRYWVDPAWIDLE